MSDNERRNTILTNQLKKFLADPASVAKASIEYFPNGKKQLQITITGIHTLKVGDWDIKRDE